MAKKAKRKSTTGPARTVKAKSAVRKVAKKKKPAPETSAEQPASATSTASPRTPKILKFRPTVGLGAIRLRAMTRLPPKFKPRPGGGGVRPAAKPPSGRKPV